MGEISTEAKCFKTNPNSRDLKGLILQYFVFNMRSDSNIRVFARVNNDIVFINNDQ